MASSWLILLRMHHGMPPRQGPSGRLAWESERCRAADAVRYQPSQGQLSASGLAVRDVSAADHSGVHEMVHFPCRHEVECHVEVVQLTHTVPIGKAL
eukprot:scaffold15540_cov31-Tisochrysis_lutea.AAC.6